MEKFDRLLEEKNLKQYSRHYSDYRGEFLIIEYSYSLSNELTEEFPYTEEGYEKLKKFQL